MSNLITINIKRLENVLNKKIKRNTVVLGLDTASKTGYAILISDNNNIKLNVGFIDIKEKNELRKYIQYAHYFANLLKDKKIVIVEKTYLKRYKDNRTRKWLVNYDAVRKLAMIGGIAIATAVLIKVDEVGLLLASQARKKLGIKGNAKKKEVIKFINDVCNINLKDDNEADAVVLALNGIIEEDI